MSMPLGAEIEPSRADPPSRLFPRFELIWPGMKKVLCRPPSARLPDGVNLLHDSRPGNHGCVRAAEDWPGPAWVLLGKPLLFGAPIPTRVGGERLIKHTSIPNITADEPMNSPNFPGLNRRARSTHRRDRRTRQHYGNASTRIDIELILLCAEDAKVLPPPGSWDFCQ